MSKSTEAMLDDVTGCDISIQPGTSVFITCETVTNSQVTINYSVDPATDFAAASIRRLARGTIAPSSPPQHLVLSAYGPAGFELHPQQLRATGALSYDRATKSAIESQPIVVSGHAQDRVGTLSVQIR